jgi:SAM-dependent methyltransferase
MADLPPLRSAFSDVDASGASDLLIDYLDTARRSPFIVGAKSWSFEILTLQPGMRALDVGCGTGEDVIAMADLAQPKGSAVGVDLSANMIVEAKRRHGHRQDVSFQTADAARLPFKSATFDACRCERTLQHIDEPDVAVGEMARVLRPGGRVALLEPDWGTLIVNGGDAEVTKRILEVHVGRHQQPALGRRLRGLLIAHGFIEVESGGGVHISTDLASAYRAFGMARAGEFAVAAGVISEREALRWSEDLKKADDEQTFFASVTGFRASGQLLE